MAAVKMATCCYCGAKTTLTLAGKVRHELACGQCGAPLSQLKMLPKASVETPVPASLSRHAASGAAAYRPSRKPKKIKKKKSLKRRVLSEVWDAIEDIFD